MRIISGKYKGKKLIGDNIVGTRPTMDRVKESLFAIVQNKINGSACLDLFAGSGSLGIESLSNGANICYFVDKNKEAIEAIKMNTNNIENAIIINDNFLNALKTFKEKNISFDIIFLDPPYKDNLISSSIEYIYDNKLLNSDGLIICEYENEEIICNYELIKEKKYGNKNIKIFKN